MDETNIGKNSPEPDGDGVVDKPEVASTAGLPADDAPQTSPIAEPVASKKLTPEEQMALYEKELKENDWGHQPC